MKKGTGNAIKTIVHQLPEFKYKDILQVIIGASILAVPVGFTEETWKLGQSLPFINVLGLLFLSVVFIAMFTYYHYHKTTEGKHLNLLIERVVATYLLSFIVVALILGLIQRTPWISDTIISLKRIVIVTFPSSLSAAIADTIK